MSCQKNEGIESYFASPLRAPDGRVMGICGVLDTQPMALEAWSKPLLSLYASRISSELQRKEDAYEMALAETVFHESIQCIAITDSAGTVLRVNSAFEHVTGFSAEEIKGKNFRIMKSDRHDKAFYKIFWRALITQGSWQGEMWNRRKNEECYPIWQTVVCVRERYTKRIKYFVSIFNDMTEKKKDEKNLFQLAHYDSLTGLYNRASLVEQVKLQISRSARSDERFAIYFVDLDHFKAVNDTSGHDAGDKLLVAVAERLKEITRADDVIGRLGGDEFVIIVNQFGATRDLVVLANKILFSLSRPSVSNGLDVSVTTSIGISIFPEDGGDHNTLIKHADLAMYASKKLGKNTYQFYQKHMAEHEINKWQFENELRRAIAQEEFFLVFQPQCSLERQDVIGFEALVRWRHPSKGILLPDAFIPIAEETGLIVPLGNQIIVLACQYIRQWQSAELRNRTVSINISSQQFLSGNFVDFISENISRYQIAPSLIELELTEGMMMRDVDHASDVFHQLTKLGIQIAIYDFGTGYSSLVCLKRYPIRRLKIDKSFVSDILSNGDDKAIVKATLSLAQSLNLSVIAEGVENKEQVAYLKQEGCLQFQGYYFSKPLPASQVYVEAKACLEHNEI